MKLHHETVRWHEYKVGDTRGVFGDDAGKGRLVVIGVERRADEPGWVGKKRAPCPVWRITVEEVRD